VHLAVGNPPASSTCMGYPSCYWFNWSATGFNANTSYDWTCYANGAEFFGPGYTNYAQITTNSSGSYSVNPPAGSSAVRDCWDAQSGATVWIVFGGVKSNAVVWP
jgi:hypothetical protein